MGNITIDCWLIVSEAQRYTPHGTGNVRLAIKKPTLSPGELPIKCSLAIPREYFRQPSFTAKIELPKLAQQKTDVKIQSALDDIRQSAEQNIGIKITFENVDTNG